MTPKEEREAWVRSGLEPQFDVWDPEQHGCGPGKYWVVDAECEHIATCVDRERAEILARSLDLYCRSMWKGDPDPT